MNLKSYKTSILKSVTSKKNGFAVFFMLLTCMISNNSFGQFAVTTNGGSGLALTFPSWASAITDLNLATITSPVIITCPAGTETAPSGGYSITAQGTTVNTIIINGAGVNKKKLWFIDINHIFDIR